MQVFARPGALPRVLGDTVPCKNFLQQKILAVKGHLQEPPDCSAADLLKEGGQSNQKMPFSVADAASRVLSFDGSDRGVDSSKFGGRTHQR